MSEIGPRWDIGDVVVTRVVEVMLPVDPGHLLPASSREAIEAHHWMRPWAIDDDGRFRLSVHSLCVEAGGAKILVDTCFGPGPLPQRMSQRRDDGSFLVALSEIGFGRDDVDFVVCTHLHVDHVGWNTMVEDGRLVPTFRNARYVIPRLEFEHWRAKSDEERSTAAVEMFDESVGLVVDHGAADLVETDHVINDEVRLVHTPGHSPGHVSVLITSEGHKALITGDCVHSPVQFAEPEWFAGIDVDRAMSCATRRTLVSDFVDTEVLIIGTHFPPPTAGHLVTGDNGVVFRPLPSERVYPTVENQSEG